MKKSVILVTGASGFIGKAVCEELGKANFRVRAVVRRDNVNVSGVHEFVKIGEISSDIDWDKLLCDVDTVIHLVSRTHVIKDNCSNPLSEFRRINVTGTEKLAKIAAKCGVRRFIYLSSIKVNGEFTSLDENGKMLCFTEESKPEPKDHYGTAKLETEAVLHKIQQETKLEIVILRPPLVYGPGVKANFLSLIKLACSGAPLPLASIKNKRSIIYLGNLVDAVIKCIDHPNAANQTFLVSDGNDMSTPELIKIISRTSGHKPLLFSFPVSLLKVLGKITGKSTEIEKVTGSLCVDPSKIIKALNWVRPYTTEQGIRLTVDHYR